MKAERCMFRKVAHAQETRAYAFDDSEAELVGGAACRLLQDRDSKAIAPGINFRNFREHGTFLCPFSPVP